MPLNIVVGAQWGDEGKGRIVDLLSAEADIVGRYSGGDNAGHTVTVEKHTFKLHQIPSGIIHPHTTGVLGSGMVINPLTFLSELEMLSSAGINVSPERLSISYAAHLITPAHRALDEAQDNALGKNRIGTTGRGIGPAYTDKAIRRGLRAEDILDPSIFHQKLINHIEIINHQLENLYQAKKIDIASFIDDYANNTAKLAPFVKDTPSYLRQALRSGKSVLAEGAQGTLLDIDQGTYPFVTSSSTTASGAFTGLGLGITPVQNVTGVAKVFQTRVGAGPFPTEVTGTFAERLRGTGSNPWDEFGTTTGRPRRVGWLDGVLLKSVIDINGITELALTKLDILSGLPSLQICVAYRIHGKTYQAPPLGLSSHQMESFEPVYEELPGWQADVSNIRQFGTLPKEAQSYIKRIENLCNVPVRYVSVGPERDQMIYCA